jgi:SAM-dependent methyltransferase
MELNQSAAKRVREKGFEVFEESLDDLANRLGECNFDALCSFQVLEHVSDPREFFEGMLRNLKVGGRLIISVPNAAVMSRIDPDRQDLLNQPPHHMSHWDVEVFRALEKILPIKLKATYREPLASYQVSGMVIGFIRGLMPHLGKTLPRLLINRYTILPLHWLLNLGIKNLLPGHTLVVEIEKVN